MLERLGLRRKRKEEEVKPKNTARIEIGPAFDGVSIYTGNAIAFGDTEVAIHQGRLPGTLIVIRLNDESQDLEAVSFPRKLSDEEKKNISGVIVRCTTRHTQDVNFFRDRTAHDAHYRIEVIQGKNAGWSIEENFIDPRINFDK